MNPIYNEYLQFLRDKTGSDYGLREGYYWLDNRIVKCFDREWNVHKIFRIKIDDELNVTVTKPKRNYDDLGTFDVASWSEMVAMNESHLAEIENKAHDIISDKIAQYNGYTNIVTVSMGKDSMVTAKLVRDIAPDTHAIFNNTTLDCAETYRMAKQFPNCEIMSPKIGFYQYVKKYNLEPTRFNRFCCSIFKSGEMAHRLDRDKNYLIFMGIRSEESNTRSDYQVEHNTKDWGNAPWVGILPILDWTELDIWLYTFWRNIDVNPKYKQGYSRVGCHIACPFYGKATWVLDKYWYESAYNRWRNILTENFIRKETWTLLNCTAEEYKMKWNGGMVRDEPTPEVIHEFMEHKGISDESVARKYFNNTCAVCGSKIKKDEVALSLKYFGRQSNKCFCWKHLSEDTGLTKEQLKEKVNQFKTQGCSLF